jgi:hypothetical protein
MKLLSEDLLKEYGFVEDTTKSNQNIKIFSRDKLEIVLKENAFYYSNLGFDYPLNDLAALRKLYKEIKNTDLTEVSSSNTPK